MNDKLTILTVESSGRQDGSTSRRLTDELVEALAARHGEVEVVRRDLAEGVPLVDQAWIEANFTPEADRTAAQRAVLAESDRLVDELSEADVVVFGVPVYNFGIPASLKAWVDMVARARKTFRYTADGPEGLLTGKKAYLIVASGGVAVGSEVDFATPYMHQALKFVGITDVTVIAAEQLNQRGADAISEARAAIADAVPARAETSVRRAAAA